MLKAAYHRGFTLVEMLVVVAIITLLVALLLPALSYSKWSANVSSCGSQARHIAVACNAYALDNNGFVIRARKNDVQIAIDPEERDLFETNGFPRAHWACPGRDYVPQIEPSFQNQLVIGYQYFGGIQLWRNDAGEFRSKSPNRRQSARPDWLIAADTTIKVDNVWGGGRPSAFGDMPSHKRQHVYPVGGNHFYFDGSADWITFETMYMIHSWSPTGRRCFFLQDDLPAGLDLDDLVPATDHMP